MRAAVYHGRKDLRLENVPEPGAGLGEIKLAIQYAGICGTDVHELYDGPLYTSTEPHPLSGVCNPTIIGHELSGVVVEVGPDVTGFSEGDLVCVDPIDRCFTCLPCRRGDSAFCDSRTILGYSRAGGAFSEYVTVKAPMAHRVPDELSPLQTALIEPMAVGRRASKRTRTAPGDIAAVHGAGPIGLGVALALRAHGVDCIVVDPAPRRRRAAVDLGFEHVLDPIETDVVEAIFALTGGRGVAASIDAAGVPQALHAALAGTAIDGTTVVVAVPGGPVELPVRLLRRAEVWLTTSAGSTADDFRETIAGMAAGDYPSDGWVETLPFADIADGFESLRKGEKIKVLLDIAGTR